LLLFNESPVDVRGSINDSSRLGEIHARRIRVRFVRNRRETAHVRDNRLTANANDRHNTISD